MMKKREKSVRILILSIIVILLSSGFIWVSESDAKEGLSFSPGQKIKQIVHEYNELRKENKDDKKELKQEYRQKKEEVKDEVKGAKDQDDKTNNSPTATSTPSPLPTEIRPTITIPNITVVPTPFPTQKYPKPTVSPRYNSCTETGGTWREFPNSCVDSCELAENPGLMCLQVITEGCDCGPFACWNGSECVNNPSVKGIKTTPTPTLEVPPPIGIEPICGNGVCEPGEGSTGYSCPVCDDTKGPCPMRACIHEPGTCSQDCEVKPIEPIL